MIPELISALVGLLTGLYFERRSARATREQNEDLRRQLSVLKASIYSLGGTSDSGEEIEPPSDLSGLLTSRAVSTQSSSGRVNRRELIAFFLREGHERQEIDDAIRAMCESGAAVEDGQWLVMQ